MNNYYYDSSIKPNIMETGWGAFPINEHAEMQMLMTIRIEKEKLPVEGRGADLNVFTTE